MVGRVGVRGGGFVGQLTLARPPGLPGDQRGHQTDRGVGAEQQGRPDPAEGDEQQRGDERGEAGDHRRNLVGQRRSRGAGVGREQLGEPARPARRPASSGTPRRPITKVAMINSEDAGVDQQEHRDTEGHREGAGIEVDGAPADLVGERAQPMVAKMPIADGDAQRGQRFRFAWPAPRSSDRRSCR